MWTIFQDSAIDVMWKYLWFVVYLHSWRKYWISIEVSENKDVGCFSTQVYKPFIPLCGLRFETSALEWLGGISEGIWAIGELKELRIRVTKAVANRQKGCSVQLKGALNKPLAWVALGSCLKGHWVVRGEDQIRGLMGVMDSLQGKLLGPVAG